MQTSQIIEERIRFGTGGRLCGILSYPADTPPRRGVLLCSPHPNFAGDMQNNVITALANRLAEDSVTLRFDYRGIGDSRIDLPAGTSVFDYWDAVEQSHDYTDAMADACDAVAEIARAAEPSPLFTVGYSFGALVAAQTALADHRFRRFAAIAPPLSRIDFDFLANCPRPGLMISGLDDFVFDADIASRLARIGGPSLIYERLSDQDHFFRGQEQPVADRIARFFSEGDPL